jgi:hypothetical protein
MNRAKVIAALEDLVKNPAPGQSDEILNAARDELQQQRIARSERLRGSDDAS